MTDEKYFCILTDRQRMFFGESTIVNLKWYDDHKRSFNKCLYIGCLIGLCDCPVQNTTGFLIINSVYVDTLLLNPKRKQQQHNKIENKANKTTTKLWTWQETIQQQQRNINNKRINIGRMVERLYNRIAFEIYYYCTLNILNVTHASTNTHTATRTHTYTQTFMHRYTFPII